MVNNIQWINIREIASRLLRHPLMQDLSLETIVQYTIDFIHTMGMPKIYIDKVQTVEISNYRGALPCDLIAIKQVRDCKDDICMRYTTDSFHTKGNSSRGEKTFKTQGRLIYTSFKEGTVDISYRAVPIDEDGFPLIPDNSSFVKALELYIKQEWFTILFDMGKIQPAVLQNVQQDYAWKAGQCMSEFTIPSPSEMESITGLWNQLIPRVNEFKRGFKDLGNKEYLKIN